ncbi:MAG: SET domain-containing protein-lysine N-methyltransferase [Spirochaetia bacterium]|nr:SET domain-containing protein-lysine N-methyltransferase [Spirochaetia bacterium]
MKLGYELRETDEKGDGIFTTKKYTKGDIVILGTIGRKLRENYSHASQIAENEYILHAGLSSKINHSCDPNCGIKVNDTGAHDIIARRTIEIDEEITFDYSMRNYVIEFFPKECMCGCDNCRGKITGWKDLTEKKKNEYKGFAAPYLIELDKKNLQPAMR